MSIREMKLEVERTVDVLLRAVVVAISSQGIRSANEAPSALTPAHGVGPAGHSSDTASKHQSRARRLVGVYSDWAMRKQVRLGGETNHLCI